MFYDSLLKGEHAGLLMVIASCLLQHADLTLSRSSSIIGENFRNAIDPIVKDYYICL
jgi:hypothetical protein